jgi:hypothetical protein
MQKKTELLIHIDGPLPDMLRGSRTFEEHLVGEQIVVCAHEELPNA